MCYSSEKSEVDPSKKQMSLKTINLTFGRHVSVDEVLHYVPHPSDPNKTLLKQEATVKVHGIPLSYYMEDMITSKISANASKGRLGLEWVIGKINSEVRTEIKSQAEEKHPKFLIHSILIALLSNRLRELPMLLVKAPMTLSIRHINRSMI